MNCPVCGDSLNMDVAIFTADYKCPQGCYSKYNSNLKFNNTTNLRFYIPIIINYYYVDFTISSAIDLINIEYSITSIYSNSEKPALLYKFDRYVNIDDKSERDKAVKEAEKWLKLKVFV